MIRGVRRILRLLQKMSFCVYFVILQLIPYISHGLDIISMECAISGGISIYILKWIINEYK